VKYYRDKQKKRKRRRAAVFLFVFIAFVTLSFVYVYCVVNPAVVESTQHMIFSLSTSAVSDAVYEVLSEEQITYSDLVSIEYDDEGCVSHLYLQTITLNLIARQFYQVAQVYLDEMGEKGVEVPLGVFTGLPLFAGLGPKVNIRLVSIGAMTSTFESKFTSAGINQTNHSLFIRLYASVSMILPAYTKTIDSTTEVLIAESVIVGKIPQVFLSDEQNLSYSPS
jgi:sporulation protein YunB